MIAPPDELAERRRRRRLRFESATDDWFHPRCRCVATPLRLRDRSWLDLGRMAVRAVFVAAAALLVCLALSLS